jgi:hypothetical protein
VGGASGQEFYSIAITNDGKVSCSLDGAPRVQPVNIALKSPVAPASRYQEMNHEKRGVVVILSNGGRAYMILSVASLYLFPRTGCAKAYATGIELQFNGAQTVYLPLLRDSVDVCTGRMSTFISAYSSKPY